MNYTEYVTKDLQKVRIFRYKVTDSTNTRAREYAESAEAYLPAVFVAEGQSAGRGRMGRSFDSEPGAGLYITFLFKPDGELTPQRITADAAVKVCRAIEKLAPVSLGIKWVNDVFIHGKKLAGILSEAKFESGEPLPKYVACGIGINLKTRVFPDALEKIATTLEDASGISVSPEELTPVLIEEFFTVQPPTELLSEYRKRSLVIGKRVTVIEHSGASYPADVIGIADSAGLLVSHNGTVREIFSGEISIKLEV